MPTNTFADRPASALAAPDAALKALAAGEATLDGIESVKLSSITLPLKNPISDAKVLTGRQKAMTEVAFLFAEIRTEQGHEGIGFSYSKRAGGPAQFAHAKEIAPVLIGEDPNDIAKIWTKLVWAGASVGRSGVATQAIAAIDIALWDLKAKRAEPTDGEIARFAPRLGAVLQHLRWLPAHPDRGGAGERLRVVGQRHRRDQDQGRPAGLEDRHRPAGEGP